VVRNAGNFADDTALGSIEYAVEHLKAPIIAVVGHGKCGAVIAAYQKAAVTGNLKTVLDRIQPVCSNSGDEEAAINDNVKYTVDVIKSNDVVKRMNVTVVGAYYDIKTGVIYWL
jgi:carbonic anhydrase